MTSYNPGTLFHIYNDSIHYTSVMTKDYKILEIKNPNSKEKRQFDSLDEWCSSHNMSEKDVKIDTYKSSGIVIKDTDGFNYPKENHPAYLWVNWCYSTVFEFAPQLLESNEFKIEYNKMVDLCNKYKDTLYHRKDYFIGIELYNLSELTYYREGAYWNGYIGRSKGECIGGCDNYLNNQERNEILKVYKSIIDIIIPPLKDKLKKKYSILYTKDSIKSFEKENKRYEEIIKNLHNKINQIKGSIEFNESYITKLKNTLVSLETQDA
jgi:hypothetical protein